MEMDVPRFIDDLNKRPGREWSDEETRRVMDWWCERHQLRLVWYSAARYLGTGVTAQDVEDAVSQFYLAFDRVRRSYRPNDGVHFCTYLLNVCFKNECVAQGERVRTRRNREISLSQPKEESPEPILELEYLGASGDPVLQAQYRALLDDVSCLLNGPLLPENHKQVFILRYLEELSYDEIAAKMKAPVGSVKGWLSRANHTARAFLSERGWSTWNTRK